MRKVLLVYPIHLRKVRHIRDEDVTLPKQSACHYAPPSLHSPASSQPQTQHRSHLVLARATELAPSLEAQTQAKPKPTLTTLSIPLPASSSIACMFLQHASVLSAMLPSTSLPSLSAGIWPDTKIVLPVAIAWVYGVGWRC